MSKRTFKHVEGDRGNGGVGMTRKTMALRSAVRNSALHTGPSRPRWIDRLVLYFRNRRFALIKSLIHQLPRPITILDVGGSRYFWETMDFCAEEGITIMLLNTDPGEIQGLPYRNILGVVGDARNMHQFADKQFDIAFSNSVIEHLGSYNDQHRMADEMRRVAKRYFLQTPNRHFPIEPHFLFPFFQFLPVSVRVWILSHFRLITWGKESKGGAIQTVNKIRLLSKKELLRLFPRAAMADEKFLGLAKSFMVYAGWDAPPRATESARFAGTRLR